MNAPPGDSSHVPYPQPLRALPVARALPSPVPNVQAAYPGHQATPQSSKRNAFVAVAVVVGLGFCLTLAVTAFFLLGDSREQPVAAKKSKESEATVKQPVAIQTPKKIAEPEPLPIARPKVQQPTLVTNKSSDDDEPVLKAKVLSGEEVYKKLLKSTAFIVTPSGNAGSGALLHSKRRLVITNYHVVDDDPTVLVFFPAYNNEDLEVKPSYYIDNRSSLGIRARVLLKSSAQDLALLELDRIPGGVEPLPLATKPIGAGAKLYSVGASGIEKNLSGTLWRLSSGEARGRNKHSQRISASQTVDAMFLETQIASNRGDSGGPVASESGAMVAVTSWRDVERQSVTLKVDLTEVQLFLASYASSANFTWDGPTLESGGFVTSTKSLAKIASRLKDEDPSVRLKAVRQISALGTEAKSLAVDLIPRLDDSDEQVRLASEDALTAVGFQGKAEIALIENALAGTAPHAKRYALATFARDQGPTLPESLVPTVVGYLDDPSSALRSRALAALLRFGPGCKSKALIGAMNCLGDEDASVSESASLLLKSFGSLGSSDIPVLESSSGMGHSSPKVRLYAATQLVPLADGPSEAVKWFRPKLSDTNPQVYSTAAFGLAKWGPSAKESLPALLSGVEHENPIVAEASIFAVGRIGSPVEILGVLKSRLNKSDTPASVRIATADAMLSLSLPAEKGVPSAVSCLNFPSASVRQKALERLASYGKDAAAELPAIVEKLQDDDRGVALSAAKALGKLGPAAQPAMPDLLKAMKKPGHCLAKNPGLQSEILAKIGGETLVKSLLPLTEFTNVAIDGVKKKRPTNAADLSQQHWAIALLAAIEPDTLTEAGKQQVVKKLTFLSKFDPDADCRAVAKNGLELFVK